MGAIDVGGGAANYNYTEGASYTLVSLDNPANDTGVLDTMELWFNTNAGGVVCGTFSGSGTSWDDRDYETIGNVTAGSKQTFTGKNCDVATNDVIGVYFSSGVIERQFSGFAGYLYSSSGNQFNKTAQNYTLISGSKLALYATGTTSGGGGWVNIGKWDGIAAASLSKIFGCATSSIGKINGVAV
jgi:hypothetical protein